MLVIVVTKPIQVPYRYNADECFHFAECNPKITRNPFKISLFSMPLTVFITTHKKISAVTLQDVLRYVALLVLLPILLTQLSKMVFEIFRQEWHFLMSGWIRLDMKNTIFVHFLMKPTQSRWTNVIHSMIISAWLGVMITSLHHPEAYSAFLS